MQIRFFKTALLAAAAIAVTSTVEANAATYVIDRTVGAGSVTGSITTDGTLGNLSTGNISAFDLTLNDGSSSFSLNNTTGKVILGGSSLNAANTTLSFDYSQSGFALFQAPNIGSGMDFFCFQGSNFACADSTNQGGDLLKITGPILKTSINGNQTVGNVATGAVPEPATWAMMILGMGAVGFAMRRRNKNVTTTVAYA